MVEYRISRKKYSVRIVSREDNRMAMHFRRRAAEESEYVRLALGELVSLSSLSVYRLRSGDDYEVRDKQGRRAIVAPVDYRLSELLSGLTRYQLELSQRARHIATTLQRDVLTSILYSQDEAIGRDIYLEFDKNSEWNNLVSAYTQLNVIDAGVKKQISFHIDVIDKAVKDMRTHHDEGNHEPVEVNFQALEALQQTKKIIQLALDAEKETSEIFSQITLFLSILSNFVSDKNFKFHGGDLHIEANEDQIQYDALSSGEKQLLIIFIETLLQKQTPYIFLTDEPELSLHIAWQRRIIPAIKELNPNAQIIAATHSPEIASKYKDAIFDMEELVNG